MSNNVSNRMSSHMKRHACPNCGEETISYDLAVIRQALSDIPEKIDSRRAALRYSYYDVAAEMEVTVDTLYRLRHGIGNIRFVTIFKVLDWLERTDDHPTHR